MSDVMDDWFGIDPPPEPPKVELPARPAPTRKQNTTNVAVGVDSAREATSDTGATSASASSTRELFPDEDFEGVGLNV